MAVTILHASDLQFGAPYRPAAGDAFVDLAHTLSPNLIVVAGDLTQRAKAREYDGVRQLLARLPDVPVVVTPGNHDVPLYRAWERLFMPYKNWKRFVAPELDTVTRVDGATVVALNSSAPRRAVVGGRLDGFQVELAREAFGKAPEGDARIVVTHHHFVPTPDREGGRVLPGGTKILRAFEEMGVDLILGGHVHQTHLYSSRQLVPGDGPGIAMVACGTTASRRGRGRERGENSLNLVLVGDEEVEVLTHRLQGDGGTFVATHTTEFPRPSGRVTP